MVKRAERKPPLSTCLRKKAFGFGAYMFVGWHQTHDHDSGPREGAGSSELGAVQKESLKSGPPEAVLSYDKVALPMSEQPLSFVIRLNLDLVQLWLGFRLKTGVVRPRLLDRGSQRPLEDFGSFCGLGGEPTPALLRQASCVSQSV